MATKPLEHVENKRVRSQRAMANFEKATDKIMSVASAPKEEPHAAKAKPIDFGSIHSSQSTDQELAKRLALAHFENEREVGTAFKALGNRGPPGFTRIALSHALELAGNKEVLDSKRAAQHFFITASRIAKDGNVDARNFCWLADLRHLFKEHASRGSPSELSAAFASHPGLLNHTVVSYACGLELSGHNAVDVLGLARERLEDGRFSKSQVVPQLFNASLYALHFEDLLKSLPPESRAESSKVILEAMFDGRLDNSKSRATAAQTFKAMQGTGTYREPADALKILNKAIEDNAKEPLPAREPVVVYRVQKPPRGQKPEGRLRRAWRWTKWIASGGKKRR
ncbi:hypothetical protein AUJ65_01250 [Candidatus Micrarchaeota archaeon CG1_02_51_15]|nr:MAG: hypothetical protein AUJ65_01250 [Candidatus Micrarchaeota archaeon CG1_02_51_15]